MAVIVGCLALLCGALAAWWFASRLARRLDCIARVAEAVSAGDMKRAVDDPQTDEIVLVSRAFDGMVVRLRHMIVRHTHAAQRVQHERLEALVVARTPRSSTSATPRCAPCSTTSTRAS